MSSPYLVLFDVSGFIFRAFYALPNLTNPKGQPIGALMGFGRLLHKWWAQQNEKDPQTSLHWAAVFDHPKSHEGRKLLYPPYKAQRKDLPEDLIQQFPLIRSFCQALNFPVLSAAGWEADDLMASASYQHSQWPITLISSDKDLHQLIRPGVRQWDPVKEQFLDNENVLQRWGVQPLQVPCVQALAGDASDNIPGVPGIGPKTAALWIQRYGNLENLFQHRDELPPKKNELLAHYQDQAFLCRKLTTLKKDLEIPEMTAFRFQKPNQEILRPFLEQHGLRQFIRHYEKLGWLSPQESLEAPKFSVSIEDSSIEDSEKVPLLATSKFFLLTAEQFEEVIFINEAGKSWFFQAFGITFPENTPAARIVWSVGNSKEYFCFCNQNALDTWIQNFHGEMTLYLWNAKDQNWNEENIPPSCHLLDAQLLVYLAYGTKMASNLLTYFQTQQEHDASFQPSETPYRFSIENFLKAWPETLADLENKLPPKLWHLYQTLDAPMRTVLKAMESHGVLLDTNYLKNLADRWEKALHQLSEKIYEKSGCVFNLASSKQLGDVLFHHLQWPKPKRLKKSGFYATGGDLLENYVLEFPLARDILNWRQLKKLRDTYTIPLITQQNPQDERIHTHYHQTSTLTGRLSSSNPNLQNIPIKTSEGRDIRGAFRAPPNHVLLSLDYSQIELRLLAYMAPVPSLQKAFENHEDIHAQSAQHLFNTSLENVTPAQRRWAKTINFGILYGMKSFGLAKQLSISLDEAQNILQVYHKNYPEMDHWRKKCYQEALEKGYVETLWGRRCYINGYPSKSFLERQAANAPLQGTAADFMKASMIKIHQWLQQEPKKGKLLLQIHDELILETPLSCTAEVTEKVVHIMENICPNFNLKVHWRQGSSLQFQENLEESLENIPAPSFSSS